MQLKSIKTIVAIAWVTAVFATGIISDVNTGWGWSVLAGFAVLPPLVMTWRWSAPSQTMSENIQKALR